MANQLSFGLISTRTRIRSGAGVDVEALLPACLNLVRWMAVTTANQKRRENSGLDSSADVTSITSMQAAPTRAGGSMWQAVGCSADWPLYSMCSIRFSSATIFCS